MAYTMDIPHGAFHTVTAPEHCAWPNLTLMPGGEIGAVIHNQPSHAGMEGDIELWVSADDGETWELRSQISEHEPSHVRMNVSAGLNHDDEITVLCAGWNLDRETRYGELCDIDETLVYHSTDNGRTWEIIGNVLPPEGTEAFVPFGDINTAGDTLITGGYSLYYRDGHIKHLNSVVYSSHDNGRSWQHLSDIAIGDHNEVDILVQDDAPWLASVRTGDHHADEAQIVLYRSEDDGHTWQEGPRVSRPSQITSHLLKLRDGRVLLSYGSRMGELYGVVARVSDDGGETWSRPFKLVGDFILRDGGYPSDVQLESGDIVTAYYSASAPWCQRFHMGVLRWNLDMIDL